VSKTRPDAKHTDAAVLAILRAPVGQIGEVAAAQGMTRSAAWKLRSSASRRGLKLRHAHGIPMEQPVWRPVWRSLPAVLREPPLT
jgi:hypothetical protein